MNAIEDARALLADWDVAATPNDKGLHNAGGFALHNNEAIRAVLRALTDENEKLRKQRISAHTRSRRQAESVRLALRTVLAAVEYEPYDPSDIWYSPEAEAFVCEAKTIQAIKQMRDDNPGLSLREAKSYIDQKRAEWVSA